MNLRKFISGVSALAIAASAFAGMAVTASAAAGDAITSTRLYIGGATDTNVVDSVYVTPAADDANISLLVDESTLKFPTRRIDAGDNKFNNGLITLKSAYDITGNKAPVYQDKKNDVKITWTSYYTGNTYGTNGQRRLEFLDSNGTQVLPAVINYNWANLYYNWNNATSTATGSTSTGGGTACEIYITTNAAGNRVATFKAGDATSDALEVKGDDIAQVRMYVGNVNDANRVLYVKDLTIEEVEPEHVSAHTVRFFDGEELLKTETVYDGDDATYTLSNKLGYVFSGWDKTVTNVTADIDAYATWADKVQLGAGTNADPYVSVDFDTESTGMKVQGYTSTQAFVESAISDDAWVQYYIGGSNRNAGSIYVSDQAAKIYVHSYSSAGRYPRLTLAETPELTAQSSVLFSFDYTSSDNVNTIHFGGIDIDASALSTNTTHDIDVYFANNKYYLYIDNEKVREADFTGSKVPATLGFETSGSNKNATIDNIVIKNSALPAVAALTSVTNVQPFKMGSDGEENAVTAAILNITVANQSTAIDVTYNGDTQTSDTKFVGSVRLGVIVPGIVEDLGTSSFTVTAHVD